MKNALQIMSRQHKIPAVDLVSLLCAEMKLYTQNTV